MERSQTLMGKTTYFGIFMLLSITLSSSSSGIRRKFLIREGRPPNTFVGNLSHQLLKPLRPIPKEFNVSLVTGVITSTVTLDRENKSHYSFDLIALNYTLINVYITVEDINDENPQFLFSNRTVSISEAYDVGYNYDLGTVTDGDEGLNSVQNDTLQILSGNEGNVFSVNAGKYEGNSYRVYLVIVSKLRRSVNDRYVLNITASDKGIPVRTGYVLLAVIVEDYNDCPPEFTRSVYRAVVSESAPKSTVVLNLTTTDCDFGKNAEVKYEMDYERDKDRYFGIKQKGQVGFIQTNLNLDYERKKQYNLRVIATDLGTPQRMSRVDVIVDVRDENDNSPEIGTFNFNSVKENARINATVASIKIEDKDSGENAQLDVKIEPQDVFFITRVSSGLFYIYLKTTLDREIQKSYQMIVTATDHGKPPRKSQNAASLTVGDVNDNPPKFEQNNYTKDILESENIGTSVVTVHATDPDIVSAKSIRYHVISTENINYSTWFKINQTSGLISVASNIDRERYSQVVLVVEARDGGIPEYSANCTVVLNILDVNDNAPEFSYLQYIASVLENFPAGKFVVQVTASDKDLSASGHILYSFDPSSPPPKNVFNINKRTGIVTTLQALDREVVDKYEFGVIAEDEGGLKGTAKVKVLVKDVNDNPPFFKPDFYNLSVLENITVGSPLVQLMAFDNDTDWNARISYEIVSGNKENTFALGENSSVVYLQKNLDREEKEKYSLECRAIDNGGRTSLNLAVVEILVEDVNDDPPVFLRKDYSFHVPESPLSSVFIGTVSAKSRDQGSGGVISYTVKTPEAQQTFYANSSGALFTKVGLDHEIQAKHVFAVEARDHGNPSLFGLVNVTVYVKDVNDNPPVWGNNDIKINLCENTRVDDVFFVFNASDSDSGKNGEVTYRIAAGRHDVFHLDPKTGHLSLLVPVDYEQVKFFQITVNASDFGTPSLTSLCSVKISILDYNDNAPVLNQSHIYVNENEPPNKILYTFQALDKDSGKNGQVWYKLEESIGERNFELNQKGVLTLKASLDREKCEKHELYVIAGDYGKPLLSSRIKFTVYVNDVNDETPTFSKKFTFATTENENPGTLIGKLTAVDGDIGLNSELQYTLVNSTGKFEIDPKTGVLQNKIKLDREESQVYSVKVKVSDRGVPSRSSATVADVYVQDVNDNAPEFTEDQYQTDIEENVVVGTTIAKVEAFDSDAGLNGSVIYFLNTGNTQGGMEMFKINNKTGEIFIVASLDREVKDFFVLSIVANDQGRPPQDAISKVFVTVLDVNDHKPAFELRNDQVYVPEKLPVGKIVYNANATDPDQGPNGNITYSISSKGDGEQMFKINPNSGAVILIKPLDYEKTQQYTLRIQASDNAKQDPKKSILRLYINVLDSNDNSPIFSKNPIITSVREGVLRETKVHSPIVATDDDSGINSRIVYSIISQSPKSAFKIDPFKAQLTTDVQIDREDVEEYTLVIKAIDQAAVISEQLSSTVTVKIIVLDVNDCAPVFTSRNETFVMEDEPLNCTFFTLTAHDKDSGKGGEVKFSITDGNDDDVFELDPTWGSLILKKRLDREKVDSYKLKIRAFDQGHPSLSTTITFTISVKDVNDNRPQFSSKIYEAAVRENEVAGTKVLTTFARDADSGLGGKLFYSIPAGIANDLFSINQTSGVISTTSPLDREKEQTYQLTVYVKDSSIPFYTDSATVKINVTDTNDNAPSFMRSSLEVRIPENQPPGFVCLFAAQDIDTGPNAALVYSVQAGNEGDYFAVNQNTGILSTRTPLDREKIEIHRLVIQVRDSGEPALFSSVNVTVFVLDKNDNAPKFSSKELNVSIPEHSLPGTSVVQLTAVDSDENSNTAITYSFGNETEFPFGLDSTSGLIYTLTYLNASEVETYNLLVIASDQGYSGALTQSISVNIFVDGTTSIPLRFTEVVYDVHLTSNVQAGIEILQLELKNQYLKRGDVEYSRESGQNVLAVCPINGTVSFTTKPNSGSYVFSVRATLIRDPSNTALCFVVVTVRNTSRRPGFLNSAYYAILNESAATGTHVVKITPKTAGNVTFQLVNGNEFNAFRITSLGEIKVDNPSALDYERTRHFELDVKGDWGNIVTNIAFAKVYISIRNVDDKAPVFQQNVFISSIPESEQSQDHCFVTKLHAFDFGSFEKSFTIMSGNNDSVFFLSPRTGELSIQKSVDREHRELYNLTVMVSRGKLWSKSTVLVLITDINDNSPKSPSTLTFNVSENSPRGIHVGQVTAVDQDNSSVLKYSFANGKQQHDSFVIDLYTGTLILAGMLDYETLPNAYFLEIMVNDSRFIEKTRVSVTVLDMNDNKPVFEKPSYSIQPTEVVPSNHRLIQINATDKDEGTNGKITYTMLPVEGLAIDSISGMVSNTKPLVYNPYKSFIDVVITASDLGSPQLSSKVPFRIRVLDANNHRAQFGNVSYDKKIPENAKIGTHVVTIKATDSDSSSSNKRITYRISRGDDWKKFSIEQRTGILRVRGELDREEKDQYSLLVIANDDISNPNNEDQITVRITIDDVNDNAPVFQSNKYYGKSMYSTTVVEDAKLISKVLTVHATDRDVGRNREIEYSISSGNDGGWFSVDTAGQLWLVSSLDRDVIPIHRLSVRATDKGVPPKASEISVVIRVGDINDNTPVFIQPNHLGVPENAAVGSSAGTIKATDSDSGKNQLIYYSLINGTGFGLFEIKKHTGELITTAVFDYENKSRYSLTIKAEDQGDPPRSSVLFTYVQVQSVDEYEPNFLNDSYSFVVRGNSKKGDRLGQVQAVDRDAGPDGIIIYELVSHVEPFAVNISSGEIYLTEDFSTYKLENRTRRDIGESSKDEQSTRSNSYTLLIMASSGQIGSKRDTVTAKIDVDGSLEPRVSAPGEPISGTVLIIMIALGMMVILAFTASLICFFLVWKPRRNRKKGPAHGEDIGLKPVSKSPYGEKGLTNPYTHVHSTSVSNSPASGSSSSGHGSADGYPDECTIGIRNTDSDSLQNESFRANADSGIRVYFGSGNVFSDKVSDKDVSESRFSDVCSDKTDRLISHLESRESLHEFDDEGGREASGGVDVGNLLYAKLAEANAEEDNQNLDHPRIFDDEGRPDYDGYLSSILGSHEELRGHYNDFYAMNRGPQYQPLSEVFSEIGRLPVQGSSGENVLECTPNPMSDLSNRTSMLSSVSSLHNQHLDAESTYSSLPMTPNFTPAITPLVTRSPSFSPLTSEAVTPMVSPSHSRPSSVYLLRSRPSSVLIQLAENRNGMEGEDFGGDVNV